MDDKYLYKQLYAEKVMKSNSEIGQDNGLTEEQCNALAEVAGLRHIMHISHDDMWNNNSSNFNELWGYVNGKYGEGEGKINQLLEEVGLPTIPFGDYSEIPTYDDYTLLGYDEDYDSYEDWLDHGEEYNTFWYAVETINTKIEDYLREIDKQYGTSYCPTGFARLRG